MIFIHNDAFVENEKALSDQVRIWRWTHVTRTAKIDKGTSVGQGCYIAGSVGMGCKIQNGVQIFSGVTIGDFVFIGPNVVFTNVRKPDPLFGSTYEETYVEDNAVIGANATIVCPVTIGHYSFIGAGSVVTKSIPPFYMAYGNPAKLRGKYENRLD